MLGMFCPSACMCKRARSTSTVSCENTTHKLQHVKAVVCQKENRLVYRQPKENLVTYIASWRHTSRESLSHLECYECKENGGFSIKVKAKNVVSFKEENSQKVSHLREFIRPSGRLNSLAYVFVEFAKFQSNMR